MKEYARQRRSLGKSKEQVARTMGIGMNQYKRIEQGYGNVFEDACIRKNLQLPERTEKRILTTKPR
jgi:transcriptional regulator with XRE-family HTH domain